MPEEERTTVSARVLREVPAEEVQQWMQRASSNGKLVAFTGLWYEVIAD